MHAQATPDSYGKLHAGRTVILKALRLSGELFRGPLPRGPPFIYYLFPLETLV